MDMTAEGGYIPSSAFDPENRRKASELFKALPILSECFPFAR
jgi:hypothetical protein